MANAPLEVFPTPSPTLSAEDYEELYVPLSISPPTPPPNAFIDNDGFDILIYESEDEIDEIIDDHDVEQPPQLANASETARRIAASRSRRATKKLQNPDIQLCFMSISISSWCYDCPLRAHILC